MQNGRPWAAQLPEGSGGESGKGGERHHLVAHRRGQDSGRRLRGQETPGDQPQGQGGGPG